jgi:hypothetical protein
MTARTTLEGLFPGLDLRHAPAVTYSLDVTAEDEDTLDLRRVCDTVGGAGINIAINSVTVQLLNVSSLSSAYIPVICIGTEGEGPVIAPCTEVASDGTNTYVTLNFGSFFPLYRNKDPAPPSLTGYGPGASSGVTLICFNLAPVYHETTNPTPTKIGVVTITGKELPAFSAGESWSAFRVPIVDDRTGINAVTFAAGTSSGTNTGFTMSVEVDVVTGRNGAEHDTFHVPLSDGGDDVYEYRTALEVAA